jgi:hypothetical protein
MASLKTAWAIVPTSSAAEILSKKCRPDPDKSDSRSMEFKIIYERFTFQDGSWPATLREQSGFWESVTAPDPKDFSVYTTGAEQVDLIPIISTRHDLDWCHAALVQTSRLRNCDPDLQRSTDSSKNSVPSAVTSSPHQ